MREKHYKNFDEITRQDKVEKFFEKNKQNIFEVDIEREKRYKALKYYLTELHKLFIKDALCEVKRDNTIDFSKLFDNYKNFENSEDDESKKKFARNVNDEKANLAKHFGDRVGNGGVFQKIAKRYHNYLRDKLKEVDGKKEKIKGGDDEKKGFAVGSRNILLSQNVLRILEEKINDKKIEERIGNDKDGNNKYALEFKDVDKGESTTLVEYFTGWSTYFKNFNEIRGNLYKDDGRKELSDSDEDEVKIRKANTGQLTTRILDENFEIFVRNAVLSEKNKKILGLSNFQNEDVSRGTSIFNPKFYIHCLLQADINDYNEKVAKLNMFFNKRKDKKKIYYLKSLKKQLLLTDELKDSFVEEISDDDELIEKLGEFQKHTQEKIKIISNFPKYSEVDIDFTNFL